MKQFLESDAFKEACMSSELQGELGDAAKDRFERLCIAMAGSFFQQVMEQAIIKTKMDVYSSINAAGINLPTRFQEIVMRNLLIAIALMASAAQAAPSGTLPAGHPICFDHYAQQDLSRAIEQKDQRMADWLFKNMKCARLAQETPYNEIEYDPYYYFSKVRIWFGDEPKVIFTKLPDQS